MSHALSSLLSVLALLAGMIASAELGRRLALRRAARDPEGTWHGVGVVDGTLFSLFGLLLAFTFSGAGSRFDSRRHLVIEETNAIGTAYLRLDLLPNEAQAELREDFRRYVDARLRVYRALPDIDAAMAELEAGKALQRDIWSHAVAAARDSLPAALLVMPALNAMFDIATTRTMAGLFVHPPLIVFAMLFGLALIGAMLVGYDMAKPGARNWLHIAVFAAATGFAVYVILDIEYPRLGLVRVDPIDQALVELRESMK